MGVDKVSFLTDPHFPFHSVRAVAKALLRLETFSPRLVVIGGDLYDFFSCNPFARYPVLLPQNEFRKGRLCGEEFFELIRAAAPKAEIVLLKGNHDDRPRKRAYEADPMLGALLDELGLDKIWEFPKVKTIQDSRQEFIHEGVCYMHGYKRAGQHLLHNLMNTVTGHTHTAGVAFRPLLDPVNGRGRIIWEANGGFLGDPLSLPMSYPKQKHQHAAHACVEVDEVGPRVILL